MIVPMKKVLLIALKEDRDKLVAALQKCGEVMPVSQDSPPGDEGSGAGARAAQALKALKPYGEKAGFFADRPTVSYEEFIAEDTKGEALLDEVESLTAKEAELEAERGALTAKIELLKPWSELTVPFEDLRPTRLAQIKTGYLDRSRLAEAQEAAEGAGAVLETFGMGGQGIAAVLYVYGEDAADCVKALSEAGFSEAAPPEGKGLPKDLLDGCGKRLEEIGEEKEKIHQRLSELAASREEIELYEDRAEAAHDRGRTPLGLTDQTVYLEGWARSDRVDRVKKAVARATDCCELIFTDPEPGENPPTVTKNNRFITPFETITDMFSRPKNGELDPNPVMGPWYWMIFGLMMGDAGYGLLMLVGLFLFRKLKKPRGDFAKLINVLYFSSFTTILWGIVFGSYFGETFHPLLFAPLDNPVGMLVFCLLIGVLHIFSGMIMKMVADFKAGHPWDAIFDQLSWMILITGLGLLFLEATRTVGMVLAILGAAVILLTAGREKKGFGKVTGGLLGLYGITNYLSDILSYSRILALSLATGVVGMVMNLLAGMVQGSVIGFIFSLLIYAAGHIFNLAMGLLSAYVHDSRLQYIEFFNKFYEGGGYEFRPLTIRTQHFDVVDSNNANQGGN